MLLKMKWVKLDIDVVRVLGNSFVPSLLLAGTDLFQCDGSQAAKRRGERRDAARFIVVVVPLTFQGRRTV